MSPAVPAIGAWQDATVLEVRPETERVKTFRLGLADPTPRMAGQYFLVRLTAPDGYRAQRSYSVATPPTDDQVIELTVERLDDGEVSTFLHDAVVAGDTLEVRGPIGGWFVWPGTTPALLIGGGSGVVPLMSMLRLARRHAGVARPARRVGAITAGPHLCERDGRSRRDRDLHPLGTRRGDASGRTSGRR